MANSNHDSHHRLYNISIINSNQYQHGSLKILKNEFSDLIKDPPEGFIVEPDQKDFFIWHVGIFGAPDTLFSGGYYKAILKFPYDYPYRPPTLKFLSDIWHPNVYPDGNICISILHEPGDDERSGEKACERWSVAQNVRSILLSIISMLNEPNTSSPANIDASIEYRKYKEDPINYPTYKEKLNHLIEKSKTIAKLEGIEIPHTIEEYTKRFDKKLPITSIDDIQNYIIDDDDDDDDDDGQSEDNQSNDNYSQTSRENSRIKLITNSEIKIAIKTMTKHNNNNSSGDYDDLLYRKTKEFI
ncbi:unnamed protein product [Rotaria sordida]|uniref:UBC core domain-containing protein n=1 Tax=Rotaria sordida TaxID=392033 RepID=A0A818FZ62_9BILA|nr:unnamed protein product [Rotaria sordida]CAF3480719.1 unnamed protein product [Rotaria sordida]